MFAYIIRRVIQSIIVVLLVTVFVFVAMRLLPGDPLFMLFNPNQLQEYTEEQLDQIREEAGLNRSLVLQYFDWLGDVFRGELGESILTKTSVTEEVLKKVPVTMHLGILAFILGVIIGIPIGVISALRRATWLDTILTTTANVGITVPIFWLGIMMIWVFGVELHWLPVMGYTSPFENLVLNTRQIIMPVLCLAVWPIASNARQARSSMLEILRQDYIRTAYSKGLSERLVIYKHALKNSLIPIVTLAGMGIPIIVGGSVLVEQVFNIPGMGRLTVNSLFNHDYTYVQGTTLILTGVVVLSNLLVDLSYGWLDPRIRYD
jgi:peptide/nickel transport system permease protein